MGGTYSCARAVCIEVVLEDALGIEKNYTFTEQLNHLYEGKRLFVQAEQIVGINCRVLKVFIF